MLNALSVDITCFSDLPAMYKTDQYFKHIHEQLYTGTKTLDTGYCLHEGYLFKGTKLCIPRTSIREFIIRELHSGGLAGHFGRDKTISLVEDRFYWPQIKRDVHTTIKHCRTCQLSKGIKTNAGLYTTLPFNMCCR